MDFAVNLVLFDIDGTLTHSELLDASIYLQGLERFRALQDAQRRHGLRRGSFRLVRRRHIACVDYANCYQSSYRSR